jgi:hypothetical protein
MIAQLPAEQARPGSAVFERVEAQAADVHLRPLFLFLITGLFYAIGYAVSWTVFTIARVVKFTIAAVAVGWMDGRQRAGRSSP